MASNRALGGAKVESGVEVCLFTLLLWQLRHDLVHWPTSRLIWGHTNLAVTRRLVALIPGCDMECRLLNT